MPITRALLTWDKEAEAVKLALPAEDPATPEWWQTDEEVEVRVHGDNIVICRLKECEICGKRHNNQFTICLECENL